MSHASTQTLKAQQKNGNIKSDKESIREYLSFKDGMTSQDLCQTLGMGWASFGGRISELVDKGLVYYDGTKTFFDQTHSVLKYEHDEKRQKQRAEDVRKGKFLKVLKRLMKDYEQYMPFDLLERIKEQLA